MSKIYHLEVNTHDFRSLYYDGYFDCSRDFLYGKPATSHTEISFHKTSLDADIRYELENVSMGESGSIDNAFLRAKNGFGDLVYCEYFSFALVFGTKAVTMLELTLRGTGELHKILADDEYFYVYNCFNTKDIIDYKNSSFEHYDDGRIRRVNRLSFFESASDLQIFRPRVKSTKTNRPSLHFYAAQSFVDLVGELALTGFVFEPVNDSYSGSI